MRAKEKLRRVLFLIGTCMVLGVIGAHAASLSVTNTSDSGPGSLRQALDDATANGAANTISFSIPTTDPGFDGATFSFTILVFGPLPDLPLAPLTIDNSQLQAITVSGTNSFRMLTLVNSAVVTINRLTISNGASGSITAHRLLGVNTFDGLGGGIYMGDSSTLNLNGSTVTNNTSSTNGGGIYMSNSSTLNLTGSTISNNASTNGGAIFVNDSGTLNIGTSTISGNVASGGSGGGIYNGTSGTVNATSTTFDGNSASNDGGGILNTATITLVSNTITSNSASAGGGVYNNATATLNNCLVALNTATFGNDLFGGSILGGIAFVGTYDLIGNADGSVGLEAGTNRSGSTALPINPMLGPLQNNGGGTFTRALFTGSPAIDNGNNPGILTDQRGMVCPVDNFGIPNAGNGADMGAFELQFATTAADVSVGGRVLDPYGRGVSNAIVNVIGADGVIRSRITSSFGYFRFDGLKAGRAYIVSVRSKKFIYAPQTISPFDSITDLILSPSPNFTQSVKNNEEQVARK